MNLIRDLGYGLRQIARRPLFSLIVVFTLAIGIGPNVAIFSVLEALVIEPLPYTDPSRLVGVWQTDVDSRGAQPFSYPDFQDIREQSTSFEALGLQWPRVYNLGGTEPERVQGVMVTADALSLWGIPPALGRLFTEEEERAEERLAVLSDSLWRRRFDADPRILGETVTIDGEPHQIVGVMPADFEYYTAWTDGHDIELWTPLVVPAWSNRGGHWLLAVGRLKPGVSWRTAEADIRAIAARLQEEYPDTNARTQVWIKPFLIEVVEGVSRELLILLVAVGFVLFTACANVASMLLARGADRKTEVAIRGSLGAGKGRILGQLLTESTLLSVLGGGAGVLLAVWTVELIKAIAPPEVPRTHGIEVDAAALLFALLLTLGTGLLFGLVPALVLARTDVASILREGSGTVTATKRRHRRLRVLAVAQIAVAFILTNGAVLLYTSYRNILETDFAFDTDDVVTGRLALRGERYDSNEKRAAYWEELIERLESRPEVERSAVTTKLPMRGGTNTTILVEGETRDPRVRRRLVESSWVSSGYFEAMGIGLLAGRVFDDGEGSAEHRMIVVNQALVDRYFPDRNPIGQVIRHNTNPPDWSATIVGVVENVPQWGPIYPPLPEMYFPHRQDPHPESILVVRSSRDLASAVSTTTREVQAMDPDVPLSDLRTMREMLEEVTRGRRFPLTLVSLFALIAMVLAMAGIFGTMSHNVAQRTREIGVRVAFGADRVRILWMVLREGLLLDLFGICSGLGLLIFFTAILRSQLYGVGAVNLLYAVVAVLLLAVVTVLAVAIPALRASRVDPMQALRTE